MFEPEYFEEPIPEVTVRRLQEQFTDMVKFVVDVDQKVICIGGEFHSDEEAVLLEKGSKQANLWGANYYPDRPLGRKLTYTSMINVRPNDGNTKQEIQSQEVRKQVSELAEHFFGSV